MNESSKIIKKRLGYPIKEKTSVFLRTLTFHIKPEKLEGLEKKLKEAKEILRFIIVIKKKPKAPKIIPETLTKIETPKAQPKEKVELKDIEKKLEEILEE